MAAGNKFELVSSASIMGAFNVEVIHGDGAASVVAFMGLEWKNGEGSAKLFVMEPRRG